MHKMQTLGLSLCESQEEHPHIRSFGSARRSKLTQTCEALWLAHSQKRLLSLNDLSSWSKDTQAFKFVEIGCGMGEATLQIALRNPTYNYLAIDVYRPGLARIMGEAHKLGLENLKLLQADAMLALKEFAHASLQGYHIFFPDPWPKARHHKRRLIRSEVLIKMAHSLKQGAYVYFVSDWQDYAEQALEIFSACPYFRLANGEEKQAIDTTLERPLTRFEKKGLSKGHTICSLCFIRL